MVRRFVLSSFTAILLFGLAACGGKGNAIKVTATEFNFEPKSWSVAAGQPVELTLVNKGSLEHDWALLKPGATVTMPFNEDDVDKALWQIEIQPGETGTGSFIAPSQPGSYKVVCSTPGHLEQHMEGTLVVK